MLKDIQSFVTDFANGLQLADAQKPVAVGIRSRKAYQPGIGPHTETKTVELVVAQLANLRNSSYAGQLALQVPYPNDSRSRCDICIGRSPAFDWALEVKMLRIMGDNGKPNDNMLMHILSPYPSHRSAVTDCQKLLSSGFDSRKAIIIYAYDHPKWPMLYAIEAFEALASRSAQLGLRAEASFKKLIHPVHAEGAVFGWEILPTNTK